MDFRQIRYFMEVATREHVTEAAHSLHVAQSSVSRQIVNLENELEVDLFIREGRRVHLTPIGKIFFERMKHAMNVIDDARREVKEYLDPEKGTIRITFPISLAAYTLPTVIYAFRLRYPEAKFQLKQALYHELIEGVIKGDFNLGLIGPLPFKEKKLQQKILFTENIVALLPIHHRLAKESSVKLQELVDEPFVLLPEGFVFRDIVVNACQNLGFTPNVAFEGDDIDALKGLVSAGLGVTLMPEVTLVDSLPRSTVKIPLVEPSVTRTVGVITPKERALLPTEKLFYDFLQEFFTRLDDFKN
ncbi:MULTISPECIES: LysR family transcriptional regulator [Priestia]|nr:MULTISPECIES: LysR family transcriptional regulator [Priestia]KLV29238.1 LysR family transcriptional regulator [Priestia megaterium]KWU68684.1 LysR family transcriptional regulator [Priestia megaterium]MED4262301.1 LysR family transcriptional regulator [Priestia aryabhattai]NGY89711.1 LysR family transcriptional regulator [Priestia megaterium]QSF36051.1 LysR family transcriptional regulator [Priestia megaterium]